MRHARNLLMVVVAGLLAVSAACRKPATPVQEGVAPGPSQPPTAGPASEPRIWLDAEAANVAKLAAILSPAGGDLRVYRWENGFVEGWVQFEGDGRPDRTPLEHQRVLVKQMVKQMSDEDLKAGRVPTANRLSGMAIVSMAKVDRAGADGGDYDWYDCKIVIHTTRTSEYAVRKSSSVISDGPSKTTLTTGATQSIGPVSGRVKLARGQDPKDRPPADKGSLAPQLREGQETFSFSDRQSERAVVQFMKHRIGAKAPHDAVWLELRLLAPGG